MKKKSKIIMVIVALMVISIVAVTTTSRLNSTVHGGELSKIVQQADYFFENQQYAKALNLYKKALTYKNTPEDTIATYMYMTRCADKLGTYRDSITLCKKMITYVDNLNYMDQCRVLSFACEHIGNAYSQLKRLNEAVSYFSSLSASAQIAVSLKHFPLYELGIFYGYLQKYDLSVKYLKKAIDSYEKYTYKSSRGFAKYYYHIARVYAQKKDFSSAMKYALDARNNLLTYAKNDQRNITAIYILMAAIYIDVNKLDLAEKNLELADKSFPNESWSLSLKKDFLEKLIVLYIKCSNEKKAEYYFHEMKELVSKNPKCFEKNDVKVIQELSENPKRFKNFFSKDFVYL